LTIGAAKTRVTAPRLLGLNGMPAFASLGSSSTTISGIKAPHLLALEVAIEHAAHILPAQGPITVFIHHNTLHALEHLPFDEAVKKGGQLYGCNPYRTEDHYRDDLRRGRIRFSELQEVLEGDLGGRASEIVPGLGTRLDVRLAMLQYPLRYGPTEELIWYVAEADALSKTRPEVSSADAARMVAETRRWVVRDLRGGGPNAGNGQAKGRLDARFHEDLLGLLRKLGDSSIEEWTDGQWESFTLQALWRVCREGVRDLPQFTTPPSQAIRHRDLMFAVTGTDPDSLVNEVLIRFCASFLDQGLAHWTLPRRDEGFYRSFRSLYRGPGGPPDRWLRGLDRELDRLDREGVGPLDSILESLEILGVAEEEWEEYLATTLLALRGWGGMLRQVESRGDRVVHPIPEGSLVEFLAIRLILDRFAVAYAAGEALDFTGPLSTLRRVLRARVVSPWPPSVEQRAFLVFQLVQLFGLSPDRLVRLGPDEWSRLVEELESFSGIERRRIFHLAYEKRFATQTLDAIALRAKKRVGRPVSPRFQVVCCLDEREESFRRHLEEVEPGVETFGVVGFYAVAMYYRGLSDAHFRPLCPVVIRPRHWVAEVAEDGSNKADRKWARTRKVVGVASHQFHIGSRSFAFGELLTGAVGALASFPLVARILFPRVAGRIRRTFGRMVRSSPMTRLKLERGEVESGPDFDHLGFTIEEMTDIGERLLRDIGLTTGFARLVILLGHGSRSQNNPHASAYDCGACGGSAGEPNARAIAQILSDPRVRERLALEGLAIPADTIFVGGYHNTCDDSVVYHDVDRVPESHAGEFEAARKAIRATSERNAHERCRRFYSAPLVLSFAAAREHVEERSEDLAQTRPELGHATNAITIVGRREWTRGLFLDRRSFLASYDPSTDDASNTILTRTLQAAFPVCGGINLEYFFSNVDNNGYGCGTKLPHNLASLLGVMDGASSDLRTGLPNQMVEIHEPIRSLFLIETTTEAMLAIMDRDEQIGRYCRNGWVQLAVLHPETREISVFEAGEFRAYEATSSEIPTARSSPDWYRGWRDHLEFAEIEA
jgi:uncharacterized protein